MVAHEYAHGYAALKQGDNTALMLGRLTWNPLKHIDPWLTVIMPLVSFFIAGVAFGGAKPVPVNPRLYRNYKRGDIIVSLAGVATNLVLAVLLLPVVIGLGLLARATLALLVAVAVAIALLQNTTRAGSTGLVFPCCDVEVVVTVAHEQVVALHVEHYIRHAGAYDLDVELAAITFGNVLEFGAAIG